MQLVASGCDVLRIGKPHAVDPALRPSCLDTAIAEGRLPDVGAMAARLAKAQVGAAAAPVLGNNHYLFSMSLMCCRLWV